MTKAEILSGIMSRAVEVHDEYKTLVAQAEAHLSLYHSLIRVHDVLMAQSDEEFEGEG
jgi:hypothetical protein